MRQHVHTHVTRVTEEIDLPAPYFYAPTVPDSGMNTIMGALVASWAIPLLTLVLGVVILVMVARTRRAVFRLEDRLDDLSKKTAGTDVPRGPAACLFGIAS